MKPLYIVGTQRNVGKTTFCIGLIAALRQRGLTVGYSKPLGQRVSQVAGQPIHDDALVVSQAMGLREESAAMAVALTRGRVEKEIFDLDTPGLEEKVRASIASLSAHNDLVIVEGMGHVAMGSVLKLSAADVARVIGARSLLISGGGIGRAIDEVCLCATFMEVRGADLMGVVVNKVWREKYDRVREAVTKGLDNLCLRSFGTIPYEEILSSPTVGQVSHELGARVLCGASSLSNRVKKTVVAAMEAHHMVSYLKDRVLVITPGDRSDNVLAILSMHTLAHKGDCPVSGLILTGGFVPTGNMMDLLVESGLPALLSSHDTYSLAVRLQETVFKITPDDKDRIEAAMGLVTRHVDVDAILAGLK